MTRYELLCERLKQARSTFEQGRRYAVWISPQADIVACWPCREPSLPGFSMVGVFTASISLPDLIEAALYTLLETV